MLRYRLLLGPVLIAAVVAFAWLDEALEDRLGVPALALFPLLLGLGLAAAQELTVIVHRRGIAVGPGVMSAAVAMGFVASSLTPREVNVFSGVALVCSMGVLVLLGSMIFAARGRTAAGVTGVAAAALLGFVYLGLMGGFLVVLRKEHTAWLVLWILLVTKSCDIGAFAVGKLLGRRKLIVWLSPGKTWEGLAGGVATSALVGAACVEAAHAAGVTVTGPGVSLSGWEGFWAGALLGVVGQGGDLIASLLKRDAGLKDASRALPGFGGVLDVIDSPLVTAPAAYWLFKVLEAVP